jgi:hypothetical protein
VINVCYLHSSSSPKPVAAPDMSAIHAAADSAGRAGANTSTIAYDGLNRAAARCCSLHTQVDYPSKDDRKSTPVTVAPGVWRRVALDFDRGDGSVQLSIGGAVTGPRYVVDPRCAVRSDVKIAVGLYCEDAVAEVRFDNVTFDGK